MINKNIISKYHFLLSMNFGYFFTLQIVSFIIIDQHFVGSLCIKTETLHFTFSQHSHPRIYFIQLMLNSFEKVFDDELACVLCFTNSYYIVVIALKSYLQCFLEI